VARPGGRPAPYRDAQVLTIWAVENWPWLRGTTLLAGVDVTSLATPDLFDVIYTTVVREVDHGVDWTKARQEIDKRLADLSMQLELESEPVDPDTWGLTPAAIAAQEAAMRLGGAADGSPAPP
jgi:hypothetical protein